MEIQRQHTFPVQLRRSGDEGLVLHSEGRQPHHIGYEASLAPRLDVGNVRCFSCYHVKSYGKIGDSRKRVLAQEQKKLLEVIESAVAPM